MGWDDDLGVAGADGAGPGSGPGRQAFAEEQLLTETRIPVPTIRVEDPERGQPARRTGPAARDDDIGGLPDDIPAEPDPRSAGKFQADPRPLPDHGRHRAHEPGRFEDEQGDPRPTGEGGEPAEPIGESRRTLRASRQVQDEEIHGPAGQERSRDRETLLRAGRGEHDEPGRLDTTGHRLHRIEGVREIQPGHDRPACLGLRGEPERECGPPAREVSPERETHPARQTAGAEDGVEGREACGVDARGVVGRLRTDIRDRQRRCHRERPHRRPVPGGCVPGGARRGRSPARSKGREGRRHIRGEGRHQMVSIEHLFE